MKILFIHLLNNYTGSPKVLAQEIKLLTQIQGYEISLLTSKTEGILSNIKGIKYHYNGYKWTNRKIKLAFLFAIAQIRIFFFILFHNYDIIYINTVVPFFAGLAAKLKGIKVIYHVHEIYLKPNIIKRLYISVLKRCAYSIICVSNYVKENLNVRNIPCSVIYNPVETHEMIYDEQYLKRKFTNKIIFMPTSLKVFKGINQFIKLASLNPDYKFILLCSVTLEEINSFFRDTCLPNNLHLIGKQTNLIEYYKESSILINLTLPDLCIETFGLTIVEGFDAYTPAIAPAYGGPREIILNGENGFLINPYNINEVSEKIKYIFSDFTIYKKLAIKARTALDKFNINSFIKSINTELTGVFNE